MKKLSFIIGALFLHLALTPTANAGDSSTFSTQDIIGFHNAASRGKVDELTVYIDRGIDINIVEWNQNDTALIKAAKFCQVPIATILLDKGADKAIKNDSDKNALDYALESSFHKGCPELAELLN